MKKIIGSIIVIACICAFGLTVWAQTSPAGEKGKSSIVRTVINIPGQPSAEDLKKTKADKAKPTARKQKRITRKQKLTAILKNPAPRHRMRQKPGTQATRR